MKGKVMGYRELGQTGEINMFVKVAAKSDQPVDTNYIGLIRARYYHPPSFPSLSPILSLT